jgi:hypothetical protein
MCHSMKHIIPLSRTRHYGPDHHIWDNNGTWWMHFSVRRSRGPAKRMRLSLHTATRKVARERRDLLMKASPERAKTLLREWRLRRGS